jgi:hypothetical protein
METKLSSEGDAPSFSRAKDLSCWSTDSSAQCLRIEKPGEIHLFPYGYFQHAKLVRNSGDEALHIRFQDCLITVTGKSLEPLCSALERLAVDRIRLLPSRQRTFPRTEGLIETIEIREPKESGPESERAQT